MKSTAGDVLPGNFEITTCDVKLGGGEFCSMYIQGKGEKIGGGEQ